MSSVRRILLLLAGSALLGLACGGLSPVVAHPGIDEQIRDVTQRIAADPDDATLYLRRGELHRIHRDWTKAETDYRRALELDPDLVVVQRCIGRMKVEAGKPEQALQPLDKYLDERPHDSKALVTRARARAKLGRHASAAEDFTRAIESQTDGRPRPEYYLERAREQVATGPKNLDEALRGLDEGLAVLGQPVTLQDYAIELELKGRRYDAALARLDALWATSARKETWLIRRGEILEKAGRRDEARDSYRRALSAVEALPESRKRNRAVQRLLEEARGGLERVADVAEK